MSFQIGKTIIRKKNPIFPPFPSPPPVKWISGTQHECKAAKSNVLPFSICNLQ
uniref:Uncharacterized protein n=1 Tax=Helianthus annuus TaxID=4232 RepID=A0A251S6H3_HELAN